MSFFPCRAKRSFFRFLLEGAVQDVSTVEEVQSTAILARSSSSSSPGSSRSGGAAEVKLHSQQRRPQLGQCQLSSDPTVLQSLGVRELLVGDLSKEELEVGNSSAADSIIGDLGEGGLLVADSSMRESGEGARSAESACLLLATWIGDGDRWCFFPDIGGGVCC